MYKVLFLYFLNREQVKFELLKKSGSKNPPICAGIYDINICIVKSF